MTLKVSECCARWKLSLPGRACFLSLLFFFYFSRHAMSYELRLSDDWTFFSIPHLHNCNCPNPWFCYMAPPGLGKEFDVYSYRTLSSKVKTLTPGLPPMKLEGPCPVI